MNVGIYDPYLHILGGAERYILNIACCLSQDHKIILFSDNAKLLLEAEKKFGLKLGQIEVRTWPKDRSARQHELKEFYQFFYVTDGSLFFSPAKQNLLIIQSPDHIPANNLTNKIKFLSWRKIICYSEFMAEIIKKRLGKTAHTLFVPVAQTQNLHTAKENLLISVGRFFPHLHNKKQKEMVGILRALLKQETIKVKLCLVGSVDPDGDAYFKQVTEETAGLPVEILIKASAQTLNALLDRAKIYWHATGYGEDLVKHPERAEHFGVSTIEAMAHGAVPIVFPAGGQLEIVNNGQNGFWWRTPQELIKYTLELLQNDKLREKLAQAAQKSSANYSEDKFCEKLHEILKS